jgi:branched-chain amino acid transport system permease protein
VLYLIILGAVIALSVVFLPNGVVGTLARSRAPRGSAGAAPSPPPAPAAAPLKQEA